MSNKIRICKGPGCKAWNSEYMAKKFKHSGCNQVVCLVPCMEKCGGGVSVQFESDGEILKLRDNEEVARLLDYNAARLSA
jgi:hypothetical protein